MQILRTALLPGLLIAWLAAPAEANVKDDAKLFSSGAVEQANDRIKTMRERYKKDLVIETFKAIPEDLKKDYSKDKEREFFNKWAHDRFDSLGPVNGVYVLICQEPKWLQVQVGNDTLKKAFTTTQKEALESLLRQRLGKEPDKALAAAVNLVGDSYSSHFGGTSGQGTGNHQKQTGRGGNDDDKGGMGVGGWICIGVCVLMAVWLIVGLVRGGGAGGGGGMGGGGFFSSLLGGMFGAAAGMWMYNNFFGGGHSAYGGDGGGMGGGGDSGGGYGTDTDSTGGGGDWGGGGGGGDFGGGGGDFGGGGDW